MNLGRVRARVKKTNWFSHVSKGGLKFLGVRVAKSVYKSYMDFFRARSRFRSFHVPYLPLM